MAEGKERKRSEDERAKTTRRQSGGVIFGGAGFETQGKQ